MYNEEVKREDIIKKVNNHAQDRFCNNVIVLRIGLSVTRDRTECFDWLKGLLKSRVTLGRIRKTITPLQNRDPINSKNETKMR
jgi:hypothetical protein